MSQDPGSGPGLAETSSNPASPNTELLPSQETDPVSPELWTAEPAGDPDTGSAYPVAPDGMPEGTDDPVRQLTPPATDPVSSDPPPAAPSSGVPAGGQETGSGDRKTGRAAPGGAGDPAMTPPAGSAAPTSAAPASGTPSGDPGAAAGESGTQSGEPASKGRFALFASNEYTYTLEQVKDSIYQLRLDHKTDSSKSCRAVAEHMGGGEYKISDSRCQSSYMPSYMKCGSEYCTFVDGSSRETPFYIKVRRAR